MQPVLLQTGCGCGRSQAGNDVYSTDACGVRDSRGARLLTCAERVDAAASGIRCAGIRVGRAVAATHGCDITRANTRTLLASRFGVCRTAQLTYLIVTEFVGLTSVTGSRATAFRDRRATQAALDQVRVERAERLRIAWTLQAAVSRIAKPDAAGSGTLLGCIETDRAPQALRIEAVRARRTRVGFGDRRVFGRTMRRGRSRAIATIVETCAERIVLQATADVLDDDSRTVVRHCAAVLFAPYAAIRCIGYAAIRARSAAAACCTTSAGRG
jgi:hypothetical protein